MTINMKINHLITVILKQKKKDQFSSSEVYIALEMETLSKGGGDALPRMSHTFHTFITKLMHLKPVY